MANAKLSITMNRTDGTISVDSVSTRIYTRDENVDVIVNGFTTGESALVPYLQLCKRGVVMAQCSLTVPTGGDGTVMTGTMSTNTVQLVGFFGNSQSDVSRLVGCRIFATDAENPFAYGDIEVYNFPSPCGSAPDNLVSGSEALAEVEDKIDNHIYDVENPHEVTAAQVGAIALPSSSVSEGKVPVSNGDGTIRWGAGEVGTVDYNNISNKPQIGGVTLSGNKLASDLSLVSTSDVVAVNAQAAAGKAADAKSVYDNYALSSNLTNHTGNSDIHVTSSQKNTWDAKLDSNSNLNASKLTSGEVPSDRLPIASSSAKGAVMPTEKTSAMTQAVGVDSDGKLYTTPGVASIPQATSSALGGIKAEARNSSVDTQAVKIDTESGILYVAPGGGGSGTVTSATINGQTKTPVDGVLPLGNYVDKDTSTAQSINSQLSVESLYVGGTRVEVVNLVPDPPVADTLYFITGS